MPIDLLVPRLLLPDDAPREMRSLRLPALEKWLARSDRVRTDVRGAVPWLARRFALHGALPVAAIAFAGEGGAREGTWLRADPVHVRIGQNGATLVHGAGLAIEAHEATALLDALQAHFRDDGLQFAAPAPDRWYVRVPENELPQTVDLEEALGRNIADVLPSGGERINWRSAVTEAQMLLSGHAVNERREREQRPAVNSLWFWGGGSMPTQVASPYSTVYADDPLVRGLGALSGARVAAVPAKLDDLRTFEPGDEALAFARELALAYDVGDAAAWRENAGRLDRDWFGALGEVVVRFESVRLILPSLRDTLVATLTKASRGRWWRARKPLSAIA